MKLKHSEKEGKNTGRVVVDTSVLISATIVDGAYRKLLRRLLTMDFELCIPREVIEEFEEIIKQDRFARYEPLFTEIFEELKKSSIILPSAINRKYCIKDSPEDEAIINCCIENGVNYLITHDMKTLGKFNGLEVIFAQDFYSRFLTN
jgi:putative PIN family toxin of toxin-antitoxin system